MLGRSTWTCRNATRRLAACGMLVLGAASGDSGVGPSPAPARLADSALTVPAPPAGVTPGFATIAAPGIVFGTYNMDVSLLGGVHTGTTRGGGLTPDNLLPLLAAARAKGARVVLKLSMGRDDYIQNPDGTFSLTKWKALVDRFRLVNIGPYLADGTIVGHFLIDEPQRAAKWGGKVISQATVEAMAQYSKQIWPGMTTFARVVPSWLASASINYTFLDAGWAQYAGSKGDVGSWITAEVAAAKRKGLGLAVGINLLSGGNGSSRIAGLRSGEYAMSATEIRTYGTALLNQSYACAFYMWQYDATYYGRSDMKSAMADLSPKAKAHVQTSCKQ